MRILKAFLLSGIVLWSIFITEVLYQISMFLITIGVMIVVIFSGNTMDVTDIVFPSLPDVFHCTFSAVLIYAIVERFSPWERRYGFGDNLIHTLLALLVGVAAVIAQRTFGLEPGTSASSGVFGDLAHGLYFAIMILGLVQLLSTVMPKWLGSLLVLIYFTVLEFFYATPLDSLYRSPLLFAHLTFYYFVPNPLALGIGIMLVRVLL